jgi:hypothetical protein
MVYTGISWAAFVFAVVAGGAVEGEVNFLLSIIFIVIGTLGFVACEPGFFYATSAINICWGVIFWAKACDFF